MPFSPMDVESVKQSRVPKKTQANTSWALNLWRQWSVCRAETILPAETGCHLLSDITKMKITDVVFWLQRFILEVHKSNGS